jgi:nucleoside-diphosphate-sugar epimerase
VALRTAMVMSEPGALATTDNIFAVLSRITRAGLGGPIAGGRQYMSWIHGDDFVRACDFLVAHDELSGAVNLAAPEPLPQGEFMRRAAGGLGRAGGAARDGWMAVDRRMGDGHRPGAGDEEPAGGPGAAAGGGLSLRAPDLGGDREEPRAMEPTAPLAWESSG